jgi:hypothetical protein
MPLHEIMSCVGRSLRPQSSSYTTGMYKYTWLHSIREGSSYIIMCSQAVTVCSFSPSDWQCMHKENVFWCVGRNCNCNNYIWLHHQWVIGRLTVAVTTANQPAWLCSSLHSRQLSFGVTDGMDVKAIRPIRQPGRNTSRRQLLDLITVHGLEGVYF